jgi:hypothetical protein
MTAKNRDRKVIATTECPTCQAAPGAPCWWDNRRTGCRETRASAVHTVRRKVWRLALDLDAESAKRHDDDKDRR